MPYPSNPDFIACEEGAYGPFLRPRMYWYERADRKLYVGSENEPLYAITSWNGGFDFFAYREEVARLSPVEICDPPLEIPFTSRDVDRDILEFVNEIPIEVRVAMQRFRCGRALGLKLLRRTPEGNDLAQSNPALFWLLVNRVRTGSLSLEGASVLIHQRRRKIAAACGCEESESTVRILAKIDGVSWEEEYVRPLMEVTAQTHVMKSLSAIANIPLILLQALAEWPGLSQCAFFRRDSIFTSTVCGAKAGEFLEELLALRTDIMRMAGYLDVNDIDDRIKRLDLVASVRKLHNFFAERLNYCLRDDNERARIADRYGSVLLPNPILPGTDAIVPIQTTDELFDEGRIMNNCVASYADHLKQGGGTVYRVLQPERCTLHISRSIRGKPEIQEIRTVCNGVPSSETMKAVREWLFLCEESEKQRILSELESVEYGAAPAKSDSSDAGSGFIQNRW